MLDTSNDIEHQLMSEDTTCTPDKADMFVSGEHLFGLPDLLQDLPAQFTCRFQRHDNTAIDLSRVLPHPCIPKEVTFGICPCNYLKCMRRRLIAANDKEHLCAFQSVHTTQVTKVHR